MDLREIALKHLDHFIGVPYSWGGDDPSSFDCSGLAIEVLKSVGLLPRKGDWTSRQLAKMWPETSEIRPGCLLFWNRGSNIGHVEIVVHTLLQDLPPEDPNYLKHPDYLYLTIGASGGGSKTLTREDAIRSNAFVKLRPASKGWVRCVDPFA